MTPARKYADLKEKQLQGAKTFAFLGSVSFWLAGIYLTTTGRNAEALTCFGLWVGCMIVGAILEVARAINDKERHRV